MEVYSAQEVKQAKEIETCRELLDCVSVRLECDYPYMRQRAMVSTTVAPNLSALHLRF